MINTPPTLGAPWTHRYTFHEWMKFPHYRNLPIQEAQELYKRELIRYNLLEEELLRQLYVENQNAIVSSFSVLQNSILNVLGGPTVGVGPYIGSPTAQAIRAATVLTPSDQEIFTEEGLILATEAVEYLITE